MSAATNTINWNFAHHPPGNDLVVKAHESIRAKARDLALLIEETVPAQCGREKALAITKCEEAMMWANAGIARGAPV